ncbi:MAG: enolase C-terminal domain-like protein, partial [archaeon]
RKKFAPNSITVFGKSSEETREDVRRILSEYPHLKMLKVKLLGSGRGDETRCAAIAETVREMRRRISYLIDCNQGYSDFRSAATAIETARETLGNLFLVEEPVGKQDWALSRQLTKSFDTPIFLDESIISLKDVQTAIEKDACSGINIKLQKAGGILPATKIADLCRKHSVSIMVGCMFESAIGISAGINFAQSQRGVKVTDLDYDLALPNVFSETLPFEKGVRKTLGRPGLGVSIDLEKLMDAKKKKLIAFPNELLRHLPIRTPRIPRHPQARPRTFRNS